MTSSILKVDGVSKVYRGARPVAALRDVSLQIEDGQFVSIVGPSGSGKSTLFNLIAGLDTDSEGSIQVMGASEPESRRSQTGYMFQNDLLFPWRKLIDNAALGLELSSQYSRREARQKASLLLDRFGLAGFEDAYPSELSGGMRQRVALLRTLLLERPLLLLDEPFASLDAFTRRELQQWLRQTWRSGSRAALLVTHDVREAVYLSDVVYVMSPRPGTITAQILVNLSEAARHDPRALAPIEADVLDCLDVKAGEAAAL